jgi:hypothetical protein
MVGRGWPASQEPAIAKSSCASLVVLVTFSYTAAGAVGAIVVPQGDTVTFHSPHMTFTLTLTRRGELLVRHPRFPITFWLWVRFTPRTGPVQTIGFYGLHLSSARTCIQRVASRRMNP